MKKYEIEINNEVYRVSVRELAEDADMSSGQSSSSPEAHPPMPAETSATRNGEEIKAPMAGTILSVNIAPGQSVTQGDTLIILEAMKMENEIVAPFDGHVGEIFVKQNDRVESDQVLLTI